MCFTDTMDSVGILEMGGASTQIAFIPDTSILADKFPLTIGGVRYPLYVHRSVGDFLFEIFRGSVGRDLLMQDILFHFVFGDLQCLTVKRLLTAMDVENQQPTPLILCNRVNKSK